jgi:hypothetical protein
MEKVKRLIIWIIKNTSMLLCQVQDPFLITCSDEMNLCTFACFESFYHYSRPAQVFHSKNTSNWTWVNFNPLSRWKISLLIIHNISSFITLFVCSSSSILLLL